MPNPYVILAVIAVWVATGAGGYWKGHHDAATSAQLRESTQVIQSHAEAVTELHTANQAATELEAGNARDTIVYRAITQQIDRYISEPVFVDADCLDPRSLQLAKAAIAGTATDPAEPDDTVP